MAQMISINYKNDGFSAFSDSPLGAVKGGLIVIHEVWGLTDHIKDVAARFAAEGYEVLAPDLLSETDIDPRSDELKQLQLDMFNPATRNQVQPQLRKLMAPLKQPDFAGKTVAKLKKCFEYLYDQTKTNKNVSVVGFCFGGSYSFSLAVEEPRLKLALPFYGHADFSVDQLKKITCPVHAFYGQTDENLIKSLPELKQTMAKAGVNFEATVYPDCGHAFFNNTNKYAYNQSAAQNSWRQALAQLASVST